MYNAAKGTTRVYVGKESGFPPVEIAPSSGSDDVANNGGVAVEILKSTETKRQLVPSYGMNITKLTHTHRTPGTIPGGYTKPVPSRRPDVQPYT